MCRQKPSSTNMSAAGSRSTSSAMDQAPVCESPLFGVRRQLTSSKQNSESSSGECSKQHGTSKSSGIIDETPLSSVPQQISRQQIHYAFSIMDNNKDGMIDVRELSQMLANLGVPIDQAILSHIMSSVSKKGDRKISEDEFVQWISLVIKVNDHSKSSSSQRIDRSEAVSAGQSRSRAHSPKSSSTGLRSSGCRTTIVGPCLVAQPSEVIPRNRRGSGSGLILMRSLSGSSIKDDNNNVPEPMTTDNEYLDKSKQSKREQEMSDQELEARNDLRAAFCVFDLDGDGYITLDEVREGLKLLGESWSPNELRKLFCKYSSGPDSDLSKQRINIDDFVKLLL